MIIPEILGIPIFLHTYHSNKKMITESIHIMAADDNEAFIEGLAILLAEEDHFSLIETCKNGEELLLSNKLYEADVLLIDIEMPILNGIEAAKRINYLLPALPMIALTMHEDIIYLNDVVCAGFKAFIYKPNVPNILCSTIIQVIENKFLFPNNLKI